MIIAAAQTKPKRFDLQANLNDHYRLIKLAAENGAGLVIFPEMSITGYETEHAAELALKPDDTRLAGLQNLSDENNIIIVAGAPVLLNDRLFIGSLIFQPFQPVSVYTKHFLHSTETGFFNASFDYHPLIELEDDRISFAICADIDHPEHAENAAKSNTTLYLSSIFFTPGGIPEAYQYLSGYARKHAMNILMANFAGQSMGIDAAGQSAFWNNKGQLVAKLDSHTEGLLLVEKTANGWTIKLSESEF